MRFFVIRMSTGEYLTKVRIISNYLEYEFTNKPFEKTSVPYPLTHGLLKQWIKVQKKEGKITLQGLAATDKVPKPGRNQCVIWLGPKRKNGCTVATGKVKGIVKGPYVENGSNPQYCRIASNPRPQYFSVNHSTRQKTHSANC
jgi:hypothetical protein